MSLEVPPRPDRTAPRRGPLTIVGFAILALAILAAAGAALLPDRDPLRPDMVAGSPTKPSADPSPTVDPEPDEPNFDIVERDGPAPGFPDDWHMVRAGDGSFRVVLRAPIYVQDLPFGDWELEIDPGTPSLAMHGRDIGADLPRAEAIRLAREQVLRWVAGEPTAGEPVRIGSGRSVGWEVTVELERRVDVYRIVPANGWLVGLWTSAGRNDREGTRLGRAFLTSFRVLPPPEDRGPVSV